MNRILLTILLCAAPLSAGAADDFKVTQLEQELRTLQREVARLSQELELVRRQRLANVEQFSVPLRAAPRAPGSDKWLDSTRWQQIKPGMSELQVIELLGPPASMRAANQERTLLYAMEIGSSGFLSGSVTLRDRAVVTVKHPVLQ